MLNIQKLNWRKRKLEFFYHTNIIEIFIPKSYKSIIKVSSKDDK